MDSDSYHGNINYKNQTKPNPIIIKPNQTRTLSNQTKPKHYQTKPDPNIIKPNQTAQTNQIQTNSNNPN